MGRQNYLENRESNKYKYDGEIIMKRVLCAVLFAALLISMAGCDLLERNSVAEEESDAVVESYCSSAQRLIDSGNYEGASEVLQEGIEKTGDVKLKRMLKKVEQQLTKEEESTSTTDAIISPPTTEVPEILTTEPPATEAPAEPEATQSPEPKPTTVKLSDVQKRVNVFLSNFAEAHFDTYPCTKYQMLSFAYTHTLLNDDGAIRYNTQNAYISEKSVNDILYKYFGISYGKNGAPDVYYNDTQYGNDYISYDGDNYYYILAAGESYGLIAIANNMTCNSDGIYTVKYDVYSLVDLWDDEASNYYGYTAKQASNSLKLNYCYSGVARIKDYTRPNGSQSYHLIEMTRN